MMIENASFKTKLGWFFFHSCVKIARSMFMGFSSTKKEERQNKFYLLLDAEFCMETNRYACFPSKIKIVSVLVLAYAN